jgi:hypothetical protein
MKTNHDFYLESAVPGLHTHENLVPINDGFPEPLSQIETMASFALVLGLHLDLVKVAIHFL